jgi:adenine deaminase
MNYIKDRIDVARGDKKADIVLKNGQLVNVFTGEIYFAEVAIHRDRIAGIGSYSGKEEIDLNGRYIVPGFIDSHLLIESTFLTPGELARAVVPHGTTSIICDPHEVANVLGVDGVKYLIEASQGLPLDIYFEVPSCVPSTDLESSGAELGTEDIAELLKEERVIKLGEMMNFPAVIAGKKDVLEKIEAACKVGVEGHATGLSGKELMAYVAAGISTDHETVALEEAREKLRAGMNILVREGSSAKNLEAILPLISPQNSRFFSFCVDDISPIDLAEGHLNRVIKKAVSLNMDETTAIQMATINPARLYDLKWLGAVAPGYFADINIVSNLEDLNVDMVFKRGKLVASRRKPLFEIKPKKNKKVLETVNVKSFEMNELQIDAGEHDYAKAIELVPGQIITKSIVVALKKKDSKIIADTAGDILKLVVVERHKGSGNMGKGLVKGFGLKRGALASSVAHDSHNIVCVGVDDEDIVSAVRRVVKIGGGMVVVRGGLVLAELPLPIAGLISDLSLDELVKKQKRLDLATKDLGCTVEHPFGILSFLTLPVIPELKLTDKGLVDVNKFKIIDLFE